ncbi:MAG: zinc ribbon domain-containing protein [Anaerolineaceae bacterium]|nr:zinc ribbon domain-containing protein [Anaerolineaceae bacterium]
MSNTWKYVLVGFVVVLVLGVIGIVALSVFTHGFGGALPYMMGPRFRTPYGNMPMMRGFGVLGLFGLGLRILIPLGLLALVVIGLVWLLTQRRTPTAMAGPGPTPVAPPAPGHTCPNCGRPVQSGWTVCPYCGQKLPES